MGPNCPTSHEQERIINFSCLQHQHQTSYGIHFNDVSSDALSLRNPPAGRNVLTREPASLLGHNQEHRIRNLVDLSGDPPKFGADSQLGPDIRPHIAIRIPVISVRVTHRSRRDCVDGDALSRPQLNPTRQPHDSSASPKEGKRAGKSITVPRTTWPPSDTPAPPCSRHTRPVPARCAPAR
jgi:hypothetical protein